MKKFFSFAVMLAAAAMVSCCGNASTKSAEAQAEGAVVEAAAEENACCGKCEENCDSTACNKCAETAEVATEAAAE
ncbi:hypothetical protein [uncultured Alistipes sp.]|uniref:hypothetical protein n=1 Tax=uncultured Alistipes sp. TaxID=538949 RepID=UPI00272AC6F9|nr:hypothetical protein [uncultured Alistipes sp.]